jgi:hypothetical protein
MTGITIPELKLHELDTPEERYQKMRTVATKYNIIQIGFCLVEEPEKGPTLLRPYNVYVFPSSTQKSDPILQCSTSAIEFNSTHGMDWNKWIREGVSYTTREGEASLKAFLQKKLDKATEGYTPRQMNVTKADDIAFLDRNLPPIQEWYDDACAKIASSDVDPDAAPFEFTLPGCNSYLRESLISHAYCALTGASVPDADASDADIDACKQTPSLPTGYTLHVDVRDGRGVLMLLSEAQHQAHLAQLAADAEEKEEMGVGARRMWALLQEHGVRFIGHNCYYDLLFLFHYLEEPLPRTFEEFQALCTGFFPENTYNTHLSGLFEAHKAAIDAALSPEPVAVPEQASEAENTDEAAAATPAPAVSPVAPAYQVKDKALPLVIKSAEGFTDYDADTDGPGRYHEAGYDAMCTAYVFMYLKTLLDFRLPEVANTVYSLFSLTATSLEPGHKAADRHLLGRAVDNHVLVVSGMDGKCKMVDLRAKIGAQASYIDRDTALVYVPFGTHAEEKIKSIESKAKASGFKICKWSKDTVESKKSSSWSECMSNMVKKIGNHAISCAFGVALGAYMMGFNTGAGSGSSNQM